MHHVRNYLLHTGVLDFESPTRPSATVVKESQLTYLPPFEKKVLRIQICNLLHQLRKRMVHDSLQRHANDHYTFQYGKPKDPTLGR